MWKRGLASLDNGDALALTFAYPVAPSDHSFEFSSRGKHEWEYNPCASPYRSTPPRSHQPNYQADYQPSPGLYGNGRRHSWYDK